MSFRAEVKFASILVMAALVLAPATVRAQESTVAEQLFREGKRLLGLGKIAEACKAFEGSYRKEPLVTTLLNLADCRERNSQYASAWSHFLDAERLARAKPETAAFVATAHGRAERLESKLSYLIINVPKDAHVDGLQLTRNGAAVDEAEWNTDIPVDGGEFVVEGKAPGFEAWSTKVTVGAEGDKKSVNVPRFHERVSGPDAATPMVGHRDAAAEAPSGRRKLGKLVTVGGGVVVLGGLATGYLAQARWSDAKAVCGDDLRCDSVDDQQRGQALVESARSRATLSTVLTGMGIVGVGVGVTLWLTAPSHGGRETALRLTPSITPEGVAVAIGGAL